MQPEPQACLDLNSVRILSSGGPPSARPLRGLAKALIALARDDLASDRRRPRPAPRPDEDADLDADEDAARGCRNPEKRGVESVPRPGV